MHEKKTFWERLMYKYELIGTVERDGQIFKKYKKVHRYPWIKKLAVFVAYICVMILILLFANYFWTLTQPKKGPPPPPSGLSVMQGYFV